MYLNIYIATAARLCQAIQLKRVQALFILNVHHRLDIKSNKRTQEEGRLTHHTVLDVAAYSLIEARRFHRPFHKRLESPDKVRISRLKKP